MRAVLTVVVAALGLAGCSAVQEDHVCPGESCTPALEAVAGQVAALSDVTSVESTEWHYNIDDDTDALIKVRAPVRTDEAARELTDRIVRIYRDSDVSGVDEITVAIASWRWRSATPS